MYTVGIICEYDPFHLGHLRQIKLIRQLLGAQTAVVCAMSGNYVQRGEPAMWDKFVRARAAVASGADLVLELPVTGVLQSAEGFARTGVEILTRLGCVDTLCFGAECGDGQVLMDLAKKMDGPVFQTRLRQGLDQGLPYAAARQAALEDEQSLLRSPNNILGLEYCRAILQLNSHLKPLAIARGGDYHAQEPDSEQPSATSIRKLFPREGWQRYVPQETAAILENVPWYGLQFGERAVLARLRGLSDQEWEACAHGSEGLWSKAMKAARSESTLEAIIEATKSKRYPRTRIQRLLLCAYLGICEEALKAPFPYVRVLALSEAGRPLLRQAKNKEDLVLINPGEKPEDQSYYRMECRAADLFTLFAAPGYEATCKTEQDGRIQL